MKIKKSRMLLASVVVFILSALIFPTKVALAEEPVEDTVETSYDRPPEYQHYFTRLFDRPFTHEKSSYSFVFTDEELKLADVREDSLIMFQLNGWVRMRDTNNTFLRATLNGKPMFVSIRCCDGRASGWLWVKRDQFRKRNEIRVSTSKDHMSYKIDMLQFRIYNPPPVSEDSVVSKGLIVVDENGFPVENTTLLFTSKDDSFPYGVKPEDFVRGNGEKGEDAFWEEVVLSVECPEGHCGLIAEVPSDPGFLELNAYWQAPDGSVYPAPTEQNPEYNTPENRVVVYPGEGSFSIQATK